MAVTHLNQVDQSGTYIIMTEVQTDSTPREELTRVFDVYSAAEVRGVTVLGLGDGCPGYGWMVVPNRDNDWAIHRVDFKTTETFTIIPGGTYFNFMKDIRFFHVYF